MEKQQNQLVINDQLINFYAFGEGKKAIIFLHGWRSSAQAWFGVISRIISSEATVYCLDLPGFGASPSPKIPYSISDYAGIVSGFIEKRGLDKVTLAGHSFGGRISIKLAAASPEKISKLILVDSAGIKKEHRGRKRIAKLLKPLFKPAMMQGFRESIYKRIGAEDYLATPELKETYLNVIGEDLGTFLPKIKMPTLLIWGREDMETPVDDAEIMHKKIYDSELKIIEDAGHFSFVDQPDKFAEVFNDFIAK